jgi:transcriptional regulator with XRE-family HTH domain
MSTTADDERPSGFSVEVGQRLRTVRRARRLSLDDVERRSGGQWSASAVGAYERGFRNLSLPRLRELALFYDVPMSVLLGEQIDSEHVARDGNRLVIDLEALGRAPDAAPIMRYVQTIIVERGDFNGKVLSVRREDVRALCVMCQCSEADLFAMFGKWGALLRGRPETETDR